MDGRGESRRNRLSEIIRDSCQNIASPSSKDLILEDPAGLFYPFRSLLFRILVHLENLIESLCPFVEKRLMRPRR